MSKYQTEAGIECTPEECKLIDSLKRLAKKWEKDGKRLWLYSKIECSASCCFRGFRV